MSNITLPVVIGFSSILIALCALVFSICQGKQSRNHNKLSVKPYLTTVEGKDTENDYFIELVNNGLGPALIDTFVIKVDGKVIAGTGYEPIEKLLQVLFTDYEWKSYKGYIGKNYAMPAKEKQIIVSVQFTGQSFPSPEFLKHAHERVEIEVVYKSFYGDQFHFP